MNMISHAECIEIEHDGIRAVIVAEGLRSWQSADGRVLITRGPRLKAAAPALGRLRCVPDRLGAAGNTAETHAVVLAKNCRDEEMEFTQKWTAGNDGSLEVELEFIVPPACAALGVEKLGVEIDFPGTTPEFDFKITGGTTDISRSDDGGILTVFMDETPVKAGIHRINIVFIG